MVICAWCNKTLQKKKPGIPEDRVSHGICHECANKLKMEMKTIRNMDKPRNSSAGKSRRIII